ncbi:MAG: LCP family protein [Syntrophomonadaceae bacterium]
MMDKIKANYKQILIGLGVFILFFGGGALAGKFFGSGFKQSIMEMVSQGKVVNILIMGIDARDMSANSRSDTMILASIDTKNKKVAMVWIPRDTRVEPSTGKQVKINSINLTKGPEGACQVVGDLLGTKVDYYVVTNFWGFEKIIDTLGGVTIDVETDFKHYDPDPYLNINIPKGTQRLNGENALKYVRYRGGPTADIGRTQRQAKFLKALAKEVLQTKTITKLPDLVPQLMDSVKTNIPMTDLVYLVTAAKDFTNSEIITQTLPGYSFTSPKDGASYWEADKKVSIGLIDALLAGQTFDVIHDPPTWVTREPVESAEDGAEPAQGGKGTTPETQGPAGQTTTGTNSGTPNGTQPGTGSGSGTQQPSNGTKPGDSGSGTNPGNGATTNPNGSGSGTNGSGTNPGDSGSGAKSGDNTKPDTKNPNTKDSSNP